MNRKPGILLWVIRACRVVLAMTTIGLWRPASCLGNEPSSAAFTIEAVLRDDQALAGAHDVEVQNGYAYTAGKGGSLAIIDVRRPAAPRLVWSVRDPVAYEDAETVLPLGDRLLVGTRDLLLFNVAEKSQPQPLVTLRDRPRLDRINGFVRAGSSVLGANKDGFIVVAQWDGGDGLSIVGARSTTADALKAPHDLDIVDEFLVVADGGGFGRGDKPGRVGIYRFRQSATNATLPPDKWTLVGMAEDRRLAGCNRIRTCGRAAVAACSVSPEAEGQPGRKGSTQIIDLSDPSRPRPCGSISFEDRRGPNGLTVVGHVAFVCGGRSVQAIGLADHNRPELLGSLDLTNVLPGGDDDLHDPCYADGRLFVTAQTSHALVVLKIDDRRILEGTSGR